MALSDVKVIPHTHVLEKIEIRLVFHTADEKDIVMVHIVNLYDVSFQVP